jgi:hypothetical protein
MYGQAHIPKQRIPLTQKDEKWRKDCVDAFINLSKFGISERRSYLKSLYDYYNGVIDEEDYNYVLKPYGKTRKNFPSKMRNYPIIKPVIDLLLGEKSKRPLDFTVTVQNGDAVSLKEEALKTMLLTNVKNKFLQELAKQQGAEIPEEGDIQLPKQIAEEFNRTYVDQRALKGQASLTYIMYFNEIYDKFQKQWFHFLISGECYSHKGVRRNEPFYEVVNPLDVDFDKDPDIDFVEDADWAIIRKFSHASTIIDAYGEYLTPEQVLELENPKHTTAEAYLLYRAEAGGADDNIYRNRLIEVVSVYWKSRKRVGFVQYEDPNTGNQEMFDVDESFKLTPELKELGAKITYEWVNEVWEGTKIDGRFYINIRPHMTQRNSLDNPSICKLPINGRKYSDINSQNVSLVTLGIPYQLNYNIYKYRLELAIARSKDIVAQFDINMIPKNWDMDKFMYYVEGTGIAWVDYNKEGVQLSPQHQSVLDMSIKTISQYLTLLESIMVEWEKLSGVTRQRQGQMGTYEGKSTSQQSIIQSSHITEDIFRKFNQFEQRELQGLLDYSKEAWLNGKKAMYIMPDGTVGEVDVDPLTHMESEYGIFVSDAAKDMERKQKIESLAQAAVQNGMPMSAVAAIFESDSFTQIKDKIIQAEKSAEQLKQAQDQAMQQQKQQELALQDKAIQQAAIDKEKDRQLQIEVALIGAESKENANNITLQKLMQDFQAKQDELSLKEKELEAKSAEAMAKLNNGEQ